MNRISHHTAGSPNGWNSASSNRVRRCSGLENRRRGSAVFELFLAVPVLLISTLAVIEFGFLLLLHESVTSAAIEGVREAQQGATCRQVAERVQQLLAVHDLTVRPDGDVRVICERRVGGSTQVRSRGNAMINCAPTGPPLVINGERRVTVCVRVTDGTAPVPDWLASVGFSIAGKTLQVSSLGITE